MLPDVHEITLSNGFRALLVQRRSLPVVASTIWYTVGSRDERTAETGLSHFLEHMMFKGTKSRGKGQVDLHTAANGGQNNAFTSYDHTAYWFEFASDRWELALDIDVAEGVILSYGAKDADEDEVVARLGDVLETLFGLLGGLGGLDLGDVLGGGGGGGGGLGGLPLEGLNLQLGEATPMLDRDGVPIEGMVELGIGLFGE